MNKKKAVKASLWVVGYNSIRRLVIYHLTIASPTATLNKKKALLASLWVVGYGIVRRLVIYRLMLANPVTTFVVMSIPLDIGLFRKLQLPQVRRPLAVEGVLRSESYGVSGGIARPERATLQARK